MTLRFPRISQGLAQDSTTRCIWFGIATAHDFESHDDITEERLYQNIFGSHFRQLAIIFLWIKLGDQIDYRNISLISRFISEQGRILSRQVNRLTLKQQRLITIAIKQAHILSLLPFLNDEKQFERSESTTRDVGLRTRKKNRLTVQLN